MKDAETDEEVDREIEELSRETEHAHDREEQIGLLGGIAETPPEYNGHEVRE